MGRRAASAVAGVLVCTLLAASCSSAGDSGDAEGPAPGATADVGELIEVLAQAGIGVYDEPVSEEPVVEPAGPVSPLQLLRVQAEGLAPLLEGGAGLTAAELDELLPPGEAGELSVVVSRVIETWAAEAGTPAAELAAGLLTLPADVPEEVAAEVAASDLPRFSDLVLLLFASDLALVGASLDDPAADTESDGDAAGPGGSSAAPVAYRPPSYVDVGAACQATVGFAANVRAALINALNKLIIKPPDQIGSGIAGKIITAIVHGAAALPNTVVRGGQILIDGVYQATVGQVLKFVGEVAGVVGTLAQVTSHVKKWTVAVGERDPEVNEMGIAPAAKGPPGTVTVRVQVPFDTWDPGLAQCAEAVGRPLPNLKPEGQDVTWELDGFHADAGMVLAVKDGLRTDAQLTSEGTGQFGYHAGVEPPPADDAPEEYGVVRPKVTIKRDDLSKLQEMLHTLVIDALTGALPLNAVPFVRTSVERTARDLLHKITDRAREALEELRTETYPGMIVVTYHGPAEEEPEPGKPPELTPSPVDECPPVNVVGAGFASFEGEAMPPGLVLSCGYYRQQKLGQVTVGIGRFESSLSLDEARAVTNEYLASLSTPTLDHCAPTTVQGSDEACLATFGDQTIAGFAHVYFWAHGGVWLVAVATAWAGLNSPSPWQPASTIALRAANRMSG